MTNSIYACILPNACWKSPERACIKNANYTTHNVSVFMILIVQMPFSEGGMGVAQNIEKAVGLTM